MNHSKQLREYRLTDRGLELIDLYVGPDGVLTGTARLTQEAREREAKLVCQQVTEQRQREFARKRENLERRIAELRASLEAEEDDIAKLIEQDLARQNAMDSDRQALAISRGAR